MLASNPLKWIWAKELPFQGYNLAYLSIRQDNLKAALLYDNLMLVILNLADGSVAYSHKEVSSPLDCVTQICQALYISSTLLFIFGTTT